MKPINLFETERLFLKPFTLDDGDADLFLKVVNSPKWLKYIGDRNVHSLEDSKKYIQMRMLPQFERLGFGNYVVVRKLDGVRMGVCGLYDREGLEGIDIGFAFLPEFERMGYGFESASILVEKAFSEFGLTALNGITVVENLASQSLLKKLGFEFVKMVQFPDSDEQVMFYQLEKVSNA